MIYSHSYLLVSSCINAAYPPPSLPLHCPTTQINTRLKSHRLSTVAHYHHVSLVNRHRVLSSLEMPHVHRLLSSVRYDSIYIVDTETSTPARLKISPLRRALSNPLQLTGTMEVCLHCKDRYHSRIIPTWYRYILHPTHRSSAFTLSCIGPRRRNYSGRVCLTWPMHVHSSSRLPSVTSSSSLSISAM